MEGSGGFPLMCCQSLQAKVLGFQCCFILPPQPSYSCSPSPGLEDATTRPELLSLLRRFRDPDHFRTAMIPEVRPDPGSGTSLRLGGRLRAP